MIQVQGRLQMVNFGARLTGPPHPEKEKDRKGEKDSQGPRPRRGNWGMPCFGGWEHTTISIWHPYSLDGCVG